MLWLVLLWTLPSGGPSTARVSLWRRLKRLGAVTLPGGAAVLPQHPEQHESFTWLLEELRHAGGEGVLLHVGHLDGLSDAELQSRFNAARNDDYHDLQTQLARLTQPSRAQLDRLRRRAQEVQRIDFFQAPARQQLAEALAAHDQQQSETGAAIPRADRTGYQNRTWNTRPRPKVDRLASGWLIRRFIDPHAHLTYSEAPAPGDVTFDRPGAQFTHVGALCTFEVLLRAFGLHDPALTGLADIVHELDLHDGRRFRPETPGVDALLRGLLAAPLTDTELEAHAHPLFDHLYRAISQEAPHDH